MVGKKQCLPFRWKRPPKSIAPGSRCLGCLLATITKSHHHDQAGGLDQQDPKRAYSEVSQCELSGACSMGSLLRMAAAVQKQGASTLPHSSRLCVL